MMERLSRYVESRKCGAAAGQNHDVRLKGFENKRVVSCEVNVGGSGLFHREGLVDCSRKLWSNRKVRRGNRER